MVINFKTGGAEEASAEASRALQATSLSDIRVAGLAAYIAPSVNRCANPYIIRDKSVSDVVREALGTYVKHFSGLGNAESRALLKSVDYDMMSLSYADSSERAKVDVIKDLIRIDGGSSTIYDRSALPRHAFGILVNIVSYMKSLQLSFVNGVIFDKYRDDDPSFGNTAHDRELGVDVAIAADPEEIAALSGEIAKAWKQLWWKGATDALSAAAKLYNEGMSMWDGGCADFMDKALSYEAGPQKKVGSAYGSELYRMAREFSKRSDSERGMPEDRQRAAAEIMRTFIGNATAREKDYECRLRLAAAIGSYHSGRKIELTKKKDFAGFRVNSEDEIAEDRFVSRISASMKRLGSDYSHAEEAAVEGLRIIHSDERYRDSKSLLALLEKLRMKVGYAWFDRINKDIETKDEVAERIGKALNAAGKLKLYAFSLMVDGVAASYGIKVKVDNASKGMIVLNFT